jgi:hypothetical protein
MHALDELREDALLAPDQQRRCAARARQIVVIENR